MNVYLISFIKSGINLRIVSQFFSIPLDIWEAQMLSNWICRVCCTYRIWKWLLTTLWKIACKLVKVESIIRFLSKLRNYCHLLVNNIWRYGLRST
jgi:hypothetical protein